MRVGGGSDHRAGDGTYGVVEKRSGAEGEKKTHDVRKSKCHFGRKGRGVE